MKPTNNMIDGKVHEALCRQICIESGVIYDFRGDKAYGLPCYSLSYELVEELWTVIRLMRLIDPFLHYLRATGNPFYKDVPYPPCNPSNVIDWELVTAPPRLHCIAFLKARGKWPAEWEVTP